MRAFGTALVAAVTLVACGGDEGGNDDEPSDDAPSPPTKQVSSGRSQQPIAWRLLRQRPLEVRAPGHGCPRTRARTVYEEVGLAAGEGPVYVVFGYSASPPDPDAVLRRRDALRRHGWAYHKTMWLADPSYRDRALMRGRRLGGPGKLRFQLGRVRDPSVRALRLAAPRPADREWRVAIGATMLQRGGCYGLQIDGRGFTDRIVFRALP